MFSAAITENMVMASDNSHAVHKKKLYCVKKLPSVYKTI
jgi:hypothetical protein